jgi:Fuc2NAc and GlcNAc transferase
MLTEWLFLFVFTSLLVWGLTWGMRRIALRHSLLDIPNQRSSHSLPTPRGGGIAILLGFYLGGGLLVLTGRIDIPHILGLSGCGLGIAMIGFWDDLFHLSAAKRIVVHFGCVLLALNFLPSNYENLLPGGEWIPSVVVRLFLAFGIVWLVNLYNFMDGIDGLAGTEAVSVALGAGIILFSLGETGNYLPLLLIFSASVLGFLIWNWPPARIFMGDACSGFLGFSFGIFALLTISSTSMTLWTWLILLGIFVVDATVTLLVRICRGEKFYQAHRSHAYQILARRLHSHKKVTLAVLAVNVFWLLPCAFFSVSCPDSGHFLALLAYSPLVLCCVMVGAGTINE